MGAGSAFHPSTAAFSSTKPAVWERRNASSLPAWAPLSSMEPAPLFVQAHAFGGLVVPTASAVRNTAGLGSSGPKRRRQWTR